MHVKSDVKFHSNSEKVVDTVDTIDNLTRVEVRKPVEKCVANLKDSTATIDRKILNDQNPVNQPTSRKLSRKIVIEDLFWFYHSLPSFKLDHGIFIFALKFI